MSKYLEWYGMTLSLKKQNCVFLIPIFFPALLDATTTRRQRECIGDCQQITR